jgi:hypothetical protein
VIRIAGVIARIACLALMGVSCVSVRVAERDPAATLLRLHQAVIDAHATSDIELLLRDESDDYVLANRGEITTPDKRVRRARLGAYLGRTTFAEYRDLVPPIVRVSEDGTLGWVIVQVYARGEQTGDSGAAVPVEFTSAWIELYEKRNDRWVRTGNVSNFLP